MLIFNIFIISIFTITCIAGLILAIKA